MNTQENTQKGDTQRKRYPVTDSVVDTCESAIIIGATGALATLEIVRTFGHAFEDGTETIFKGTKNALKASLSKFKSVRNNVWKSKPSKNSETVETPSTGSENWGTATA